MASAIQPAPELHSNIAANFITGIGTVNGGTSGYQVADTITLANGVVLAVASVSSGVVATVTVSTAGAFTGQVATNPVAQTSTNGSGVGTPTFTLAYGLGTAAIVDVRISATSVATMISSLPDFKWSIIRSRCA